MIGLCAGSGTIRWRAWASASQGVRTRSRSRISVDRHCFAGRNARLSSPFAGLAGARLRARFGHRSTTGSELARTRGIRLSN